MRGKAIVNAYGVLHVLPLLCPALVPIASTCLCRGLIFYLSSNLRNKKKGRKNGKHKVEKRKPEQVPLGEWKEIFAELDDSHSLREVSRRHRLAATSVWRAYTLHKNPDQAPRVHLSQL